MNILTTIATDGGTIAAGGGILAVLIGAFTWVRSKLKGSSNKLQQIVTLGYGVTQLIDEVEDVVKQIEENKNLKLSDLKKDLTDVVEKYKDVRADWKELFNKENK